MMILSLYAVTMILAVTVVLKGSLENTPVERRVNRALKHAVQNGVELGATTGGRRFTHHDMVQACNAGPSQAVSSPAWA